MSTDPMTLHYPDVATIKSDEHGEWASVLCGAVGSYYSADVDAVTCSTCRELVQS